MSEKPCPECHDTGTLDEGWCDCKKGRECLNRMLQIDDDILTMGGAVGIGPRKRERHD